MNRSLCLITILCLTHTSSLRAGLSAPALIVEVPDVGVVWDQMSEFVTPISRSMSELGVGMLKNHFQTQMGVEAQAGDGSMVLVYFVSSDGTAERVSLLQTTDPLGRLRAMNPDARANIERLGNGIVRVAAKKKVPDLLGTIKARRTDPKAMVYKTVESSQFAWVSSGWIGMADDEGLLRMFAKNHGSRMVSASSLGPEWHARIWINLNEPTVMPALRQAIPSVATIALMAASPSLPSVERWWKVVKREAGSLDVLLKFNGRRLDWESTLALSRPLETAPTGLTQAWVPSPFRPGTLVDWDVDMTWFNQIAARLETTKDSPWHALPATRWRGRGYRWPEAADDWGLWSWLATSDTRDLEETIHQQYATTIAPRAARRAPVSDAQMARFGLQQLSVGENTQGGNDLLATGLSGGAFVLAFESRAPSSASAGFRVTSEQPASRSKPLPVVWPSGRPVGVARVNAPKLVQTIVARNPQPNIRLLPAGSLDGSYSELFFYQEGHRLKCVGATDRQQIKEFRKLFQLY